MDSTNYYQEGQLVAWHYDRDDKEKYCIAIITHVYPQNSYRPWNYHITYFDNDETEFQCYGCKHEELAALLLTSCDTTPIIFGKIGTMTICRLLLLSDLVLPSSAEKFGIGGWLDFDGQYPYYGIPSPFPDDHNTLVFVGDKRETERVAKILTNEIITKGYKRAALAGKDLEF
jgi:hypothetical protein